MSTLVTLRPARAVPLFDGRSFDPRDEAVHRPREDDPCGGERVIDFALCLVVAAAVVGLLLLAL